MSLVTIKNISKAYFSHTLFDNLSFNIDNNDRLAILGDNGTGKTTILKLIADCENVDSGKIIRSANLRIGYLQQNMNEQDLSLPVWQESSWQNAKLNLEKITEKFNTADQRENDRELLNEYQHALHLFESLGGYNYEYNLKIALSGLGLPENIINRSLKSCSGGELMRVTLAKLLLSNPDLLLLDEPTNHLDLTAIEWLIQYLQTFKGTICFVSHDRYFLQALATRCAFLTANGLRIFNGNYDIAIEAKKVEDERLRQEEVILTKELSRQEEIKQKFLSHRNISGYHSREKLINKLNQKLEEVAQKNRANNQGRLSFKFQDCTDDSDPNRIILTTADLGFSFNDEQPLLKNININLKASDKAVLIGKNGSGKTTFLNILSGKLNPSMGKLKLIGDISFAYMKQIVEFPIEGLTCLETLMDNTNLDEKKSRNILAQFGFKDIDIYKSTDILSGGERSRLYLCCILQLKPKLIFLDEPTNHLDIYSRIILEKSIQAYNGAVIAISHDRYFINQFANKFWSLENNNVVEYNNIEQAIASNKKFYANKIDREKTDNFNQRSVSNPSIQNSPVNRDSNKERKSIKNISPSTRRRKIVYLQNMIKEVEKDIELTEEKISAVQENLAAVYNAELYSDLEKMINHNEEIWEKYAEYEAELRDLQTEI